MKTVKMLPENYQETLSVDLGQNKKLSLFVNLLSIAMMLVMAVGMAVLVPIPSLFAASGLWWLVIRFLVIMAALVLYILLHELTHGITMKLCGAEKVSYGFTGVYAYAGCREFFPKKAYITVALAPVILWGIVLSVVCILVPTEWFWVFYIVQITNISGAAGDLYVIFRFFTLPDDVLIFDTGTAMTVYAPMKE